MRGVAHVIAASGDTMIELEQKIATALVDDAGTSVALILLITEVEGGITAAEQAAETARARALDPIAMVDAHEASVAVMTAKLTAERLQAALPKLRERLREAEAREYRASFEPEFERVQALRDEMATEVQEVYSPTIIDLFDRMKTVDEEVSRLNSAASNAPYGEMRRLVAIEAHARPQGSPSLPETVRLPLFESTTEMAWPRPIPPLWVPMAVPFHPGADWQAFNEARDYRSFCSTQNSGD